MVKALLIMFGVVTLIVALPFLVVSVGIAFPIVCVIAMILLPGMIIGFIAGRCRKKKKEETD